MITDLLKFIYVRICTCSTLSLYVADTLPGQAGPVSAYVPYLEKIATRLAQLNTAVIFGITTPELCSASSDQVVQHNNVAAVAIMTKLGIKTVDMHSAITAKCGDAPQTECFGSKGCFCPHCPANVRAETNTDAYNKFHFHSSCT